MNENEEKSLELYRKKMEAGASLFNDFQANDYIRLLKNNDMLDEAIEVGRTFLEMCPELNGYINQFGYTLYNKYINLDNDKIAANEDVYFSVVKEILAICKSEKYSPFDATVNKAIKYVLSRNPIDYTLLLSLLEYLDPKDLSDIPFINNEGKEFESKKERYYRLLVRALFETSDYTRCIEIANNALSLALKWHYNALQWIKYYRGCALVNTGNYKEAEKEFLSLNNRIRGVNFYEVLYTTYANLNLDKQANAYLLYEFFEKGFDITHLELYKHLLEATKKTNNEKLIDCVDRFITQLCKENNKAYTPLKEYTGDTSASDLYDDMYNKIMAHLSLFVERKEGMIVHYNATKQLGTIAESFDDEGVFFRQRDYVYDEEVQRKDKVEYTLLPTYDSKKQRVTEKAILIITTDEYVNYGY